MSHHSKYTLEVLSFEHELTSISFDYSLAPYERRVIELLRNSKDKRARKLAKKRVRLFCPTHVLFPEYSLLFFSSVPSAVPRPRSRR